jgi:ubiquitin
MSIPEGFDTDDIMSIEDFLKNEVVNEALDDADVTPVDIDELKQKRLGAPSTGVDPAKRPERMLHKSNIIDEDGNVIDNDKLKKQITTRPANIIGQNKKLEKSGLKTGQIFYDLTLPSYMGLFVDESTGEFKVVRTCPAAGECSKFCYAARGNYVMFPASSMSAARVVNYLMNDPDGFKHQALSELAKAQRKADKHKQTLVLRWHDSGDFLSEKYLQLAFSIARETPNIIHYAYTKQIPLVKKLKMVRPDNFVFNFSFGGLHDVEIDPMVDKHSRVVPQNLFRDLPQTKTTETIEFPEISIQTLKNRVAKNYNVSPKSVITYDELLNIPKDDKRKWNVLVWKGHGDDAATRKNVLGTYLLFH